MVANRVLVTGCNRGIGLALVKAFLCHPEPPQLLIASCRDMSKAKELQELADKYKCLRILPLELKDLSSYEAAVKHVSDMVEDKGLNLLINNAGIMKGLGNIEEVTWEDLAESFTVNVTAPVIFTQKLLPLLRKASKIERKLPLSIRRAAIVNMSTGVASVERNTSGRLYPYRCSKAALNMASKSMSVDLAEDGILSCSLHPGWVQTDMGGKNAPISLDKCSRVILKTLSSLSEAHQGSFIQYDGKPLPW